MPGIVIYKSYSFKDKDPVIDEMRTLFQKEGLFTAQGFKSVHEAGAPTISTFNKWFKGDTRRPQNAAIMATAHALGYERNWVKKKGGKK